MIYVKIRFASDIASKDLMVSAKVAGFKATGWVRRHEAAMYLLNCRSIILSSLSPNWRAKHKVIAKGNALIDRGVALFAIWRITGLIK